MANKDTPLDAARLAQETAKKELLTAERGVANLEKRIADLQKQGKNTGELEKGLAKATKGLDEKTKDLGKATERLANARNARAYQEEKELVKEKAESRRRRSSGRRPGPDGASSGATQGGQSQGDDGGQDNTRAAKSLSNSIKKGGGRKAARGLAGVASGAIASGAGVGGAADAVADAMIGGGLTTAIASGGTLAVPGLLVALGGGAIKGVKALSEYLGYIVDKQKAIQKYMTQMSAPRFRNFGLGRDMSLKGITGIDDAVSARKAYAEEIADLAKVFKESTVTASHFGLSAAEADELRAGMKEIGELTGESYSDGVGSFFATADGKGGIIHQIAEMAADGFGTVDQLTKQFVVAKKSYGMSSEEALDSMHAVQRAARETSLLRLAYDPTKSLDKAVVRMEDFAGAVEEVRSGIDSLVASEKGLSRVMKLGLVLANRTKMTQLQQIKGAVELAKAYTSNYDEGFATLTSFEDLDLLYGKYAKKKAEGTITESEQAKLGTLEALKKGKEAGEFTPDVLAKFLSQGGFDEELFAKRLEEGMQSPVYGMMQARQKTDIGLEQYLLMQKARAEGVAPKDIARIMMEQAVTSKYIGKEEERAYLSRTEAIRERKVAAYTKDEIKLQAEQALGFLAASSDTVTKAFSEVAAGLDSFREGFEGVLGVIPSVDERVAARAGVVDTTNVIGSRRPVSTAPTGSVVGSPTTGPDGTTSVTVKIEIPGIPPGSQAATGTSPQ